MFFKGRKTTGFLAALILTALIVTPVQADQIDKTELSALISECGNMDLSTYEDASASALEDALAEGQFTLNRVGAAQEDVDAAAEEIKDARNALTEKSRVPGVVMIVAAVVVIAVIISVMIVIVAMMSKKKLKKGLDSKSDHAPADISSAQKSSNLSGGGSSLYEAAGFQSGGSDAGSSETSILDNGSGETVLLGSETVLLTETAPDIPAILVRMKNGEQIRISKQVFKIGKEHAKTDYCISDNSSVSRVHAQIAYRGKEYYLTDMKSTNHTRVNGSILADGQEIKLQSGDKISFSNEDFEFKY